MATTQLQMTTEEYNDLSTRFSIEEIAMKLEEKAATLKMEILDTTSMIKSVVNDHEVSLRCTNEWYPPVVRA